MSRTVVIRKSMTAFVCGLIGFLPVVGLLPGLYALSCWAHIRTRHPGEWNPAAAYLSWGARLSLLGLLGTALIVASMAITYDW
jgi:hypothetical protein